MPVASTLPARAVKLRIEVEDSNPAIWREVVVPLSIDLSLLHVVICRAMPWESGEAHEFVFGNMHYGESHPLDGLPDGLNDEDMVTLAKALRARRSFEYVYDFSSAWWHRITVLGAVQSETEQTSPQCTAGANACPPPGIRGLGEYEDFRDALADPKHPRAAEFRSIAQGPFDPTAFDIAEVNARLSEIRFR